MPQKTQTLSVPGYGKEYCFLLAYATLLRLGWTPKYVDNEKVIGYPEGNLDTCNGIITVEILSESITVTSKLPVEFTQDLYNVNRDNLDRFTIALEEMKSLATPDKLIEWENEVDSLRQATVATIEEDVKLAEEVDKILRVSKADINLTLLIIFLNVAMFLIMTFSGVNILLPSSYDLLSSGGNYKPYTIGSGQWWRLITSMFIHGGIIHLFVNMFALLDIGFILESMLGKLRFGFAYFFTGVAGGLTSVFWHSKNVVSVGASGAIFGMCGVFLALLTTKLLPKKFRKSLLRNVALLTFCNLAYGIKAGIDNAAHIGGVLSGMLLGYLYYFGLKYRITSDVNSTTVA